ncbi:MAG: hypothetical protein RIQ78_1205 [Bacteroidota bacterium]
MLTGMRNSPNHPQRIGYERSPGFKERRNDFPAFQPFITIKGLRGRCVHDGLKSKNFDPYKNNKNPSCGKALQDGYGKNSV